MKLLLTILSFLSLAFISHPVKPKQGWSDTMRLGSRVRLNITGKNAYFYGNSITAGSLATDSLHWWVTLFCQATGATQVNHGVSGMTMTQTGCGNYFDPSVIPTYNASTDGVLFLDFGTNDIGFIDSANNLVTPENFRLKTRAVLNTAISAKLWPANKIVVLTTYYALGYNVFLGLCSSNINMAATQTRAAEFQEIALQEARAKHCWSIDVRTPMLGLDNSYYNTDSLHPNNPGHAFIANHLLKVL